MYFGPLWQHSIKNVNIVSFSLKQSYKCLVLLFLCLSICQYTEGMWLNRHVEKLSPLVGFSIWMAKFSVVFYREENQLLTLWHIRPCFNTRTRVLVPSWQLSVWMPVFNLNSSLPFFNSKVHNIILGKEKDLNRHEYFIKTKVQINNVRARYKIKTLGTKLVHTT